MTFRKQILTEDQSMNEKLQFLNPRGFVGGKSVVKGKASERAKTIEANALNESKKNDQMIKIARLKVKKAWDLALSPAKSIPMNAFMLYMSGNSIQIFSVMITVMLLWNSINSIVGCLKSFEQYQVNTNPEESQSFIQSFKRLSESNLLLPVAVFVIIQFGNLSLGVWKCAGMGLLPTTTSDWLSFMTAPVILERVAHTTTG